MRARTLSARPIVIAVVIGGLVLAGCSSSSKTSSPSSNTSATTTPTTPATPKTPLKVTITARDYSFELPAQLPSGYVDVTLDNQGKQDHQAQLVKLGSMSFAQFKAAAVTTNIGAAKGATFVGGPNDAAPGKSTSAIVKLDPGAYAIVCFIPLPGTQNTPHASRGMIGQFQVVKQPDSDDVAPVASSTITLGDFSFLVPTGFTGKGVVDISNQGAEVHELNLFKVAPGLTEAQALAAVAGGPPAGATGPPPVTELMGTVGLSPQQHAWLDMNLAPGNYFLICFFPDPKKGNEPHFLEGMHKLFTVT